MEENTNKGGYGKRPLWQWILLYVVIGLIVYGAIYYFVLAKHGGYYSGSMQYNQGTQQQNSQQNKPKGY